MRFAPLLLALPILFAACGGSADPDQLTKDGESALGNHDVTAAASHFDEALAAIGADTTHPMYVRAKLGMAEAFAGSDPGQSQSILTELQKSLGAKVTASDFIRVMNKMSESTADGAIAATAATLKVALAAYPDARAKLDTIGRFLNAKAAKSGDTEGASALDGLGYTGSD